MKIKKYIAPTMPEAMKLIRKELGPDAVILNSKEIKQGGIFGLFKKNKIEVVAGLDPSPLPSKSSKQTEKRPANRPVSKSVKDHEKSSQEEVLKEIQQLKKYIEIHSKKTNESYPVEYHFVYQHLLEQEVDEHLAKEILDSVSEQDENSALSKEEILSKTKQIIKDMIKNYTFEGITYNKKVVQFVGPTGVGKTTTLAKIASHMILKDNKRVAFITSDTYRIAAVEQLKTYARILNVPLEVAYTVEDYKNAIDKFQSYDIILVDTAGRNFREEKYVKDLMESMKYNIEMETFLVLSLTSKPKDIAEIYDQFHHIPIKEVIFTKIDETRQYGSILNTCVEKQIGIAYLTNGQDVPNDILDVNPDRIANLIVGDIGDE
ncbi:flagellar biosynthesis protein FlhF [Oceanobacillus salinisoli]|uniref:flagellar biosynthesis protein FlhF n=1 Tax=Oceanobacillus salinisoli TaxID=2678611 RepID=UPI0012E314B5|nr:flagellar biosynthesis protein FlhF [Oceanobacillus salinisoli]